MQREATVEEAREQDELRAQHEREVRDEQLQEALRARQEASRSLEANLRHEQWTARRHEAETRKAARLDAMRGQALLEAHEIEKARAIHAAKQKKFRFPELVRLANAYGVSGEAVPRYGMGWLDLFRLIVDQIPVSIMLVDMEMDGLPLLHTNPAATSLTGYAREEMMGRNCRFLRRDDTCRFIGGKEITAPEQRALRRSIAEAKTVTVRVLNFRKDGSQFWNILSMHPVHHAGTAAYCYNIGVQALYDELTLNPQPSTLDPRPSTLHPPPSTSILTPHPSPRTPQLAPLTLTPCRRLTTSTRAPSRARPGTAFSIGCVASCRGPSSQRPRRSASRPPPRWTPSQSGRSPTPSMRPSALVRRASPSCASAARSTGIERSSTC